MAITTKQAALALIIAGNMATVTLPVAAEVKAGGEADQNALSVSVDTKLSSTADHTKFDELKQVFKTGPEVTRACLSCHTEASKQLHQTTHWTWDYLNPTNKQRLGKKNVINNFCTSVESNLKHCSSCHIGYGWEDDSFDFASEENVDCLACHDTTNTYRKLAGLAGHPTYKLVESPPGSNMFRQPPDLSEVAQNVGKTSRQTCGNCHFKGGGGNAVKHGDLDLSLVEPKRYLDIHMDKDGLNFSCAKCHMTREHQVPGSRYNPTASDPEGAHLRGLDDDRNPATCEACHDTAPHPPEMAKLNEHTSRVACQTCHIPSYARGGYDTKMTWDWSTAGKLNEKGKPVVINNSTGHPIYHGKKGNFTYDSYVIPEYVWFNGDVSYTMVGDKIIGDEIVKINEFHGQSDDPDSRIWPVKVFRGKQPYDVGNEQLVVFHTYGKDDAAYWKNFNWDKAIKWGMKSLGQEYSGKMGFVETEMSWPITHMVTPKEDALGCKECHKKNGRLEGVPGVYLPGRDSVALLDMAGGILALLSLLGVLFHGGLRYLASRKKKG